MKRKIIGIFICTLLIATTTLSASAEYNENAKEIFTYNDDDVPIWNNGDSWTFTINDFNADYTYEGKKISIAGKIDDLKLIVSDTSGSSYRVDITGEITGSYEIYIPIGSLFLKFTGTISPTLTSLTGAIIFSKANLEIEDFNAQITGITSISIHPFSMKIPFPIKLTADADLSTPFPLFNFPLHILKFWNMPEIDITTHINFGGLFGLFKIPMTVYTHYDFIPLAFSILIKESITVEAGIYEAWKIQSLLGGFFEYYYAPAVGNFIKIDVNMPRGGIEGELKATNYV